MGDTSKIKFDTILNILPKYRYNNDTILDVFPEVIICCLSQPELRVLEIRLRSSYVLYVLLRFSLHRINSRPLLCHGLFVYNSRQSCKLVDRVSNCVRVCALTQFFFSSYHRGSSVSDSTDWYRCSVPLCWYWYCYIMAG